MNRLDLATTLTFDNTPSWVGAGITAAVVLTLAVIALISKVRSVGATTDNGLAGTFGTLAGIALLVGAFATVVVGGGVYSHGAQLKEWVAAEHGLDLSNEQARHLNDGGAIVVDYQGRLAIIAAVRNGGTVRLVELDGVRAAELVG